MLDVKTGVSKSTGNPWTSREYLATYKEGDKDVQFQFIVFGDYIAPLIAGKTYALTMMIECREWQGKYYNTVRATNAYIQADGGGQSQTAQTEETPTQPIPQKPAAVLGKDGKVRTKPQSNDDNGIPF